MPHTIRKIKSIEVNTNQYSVQKSGRETGGLHLRLLTKSQKKNKIFCRMVWLPIFFPYTQLWCQNWFLRALSLFFFFLIFVFVEKKWKKAALSLLLFMWAHCKWLHYLNECNPKVWSLSTIPWLHFSHGEKLGINKVAGKHGKKNPQFRSKSCLYCWK